MHYNPNITEGIKYNSSRKSYNKSKIVIIKTTQKHSHKLNNIISINPLQNSKKYKDLGYIFIKKFEKNIYYD